MSLDAISVQAGLRQKDRKGQLRKKQVRSGSGKPNAPLLSKLENSEGLADPMRGCFRGGDITAATRQNR
jgi:hypothetical protein